MLRLLRFRIYWEPRAVTERYYYYWFIADMSFGMPPPAFTTPISISARAAITYASMYAYIR